MSERAVILLVDDDPLLLKGLALHLRRRYEVILASSAEEALGKLEGVAVLVCDLRMPVMDGLSLLARASVLAPTVTRILFSGESVAASELVHRVLDKPCDMPVLIAALDEAVARHRREAA